MTNADKFKEVFDIYATELWAMPEADFLKWLNTDRKTEPQTHEIRTNTHECVKDTHDKTENSSEKPNNSTISKMEQVDKDINVRSKDEPQTDCAWK